MEFMEAVKHCFNNYFNVQGRASRSEYWWFFLFNCLVHLVLGLLSLGTLNAIYELFVLAPQITVSVRRHHDGNRSGWWLLLYIIPLIGFLVHLYWFIQKGTDGPNSFGEDPLRATYEGSSSF